MDWKKKEGIRLGLWLVFTLSFALLCFYQIVYYSGWIIVCTVIGSAVVGFLLIRKTGDEMLDYIRTHRLPALACLCAALIVTVAMHLDRSERYIDLVLHPLPFLGVRFFRLRWMVFTIPALFYLLLWLGRKAAGFFSSFWKGLSPADRKLYAGITLLASAAVLIAYVSDSAWFLQYDQVYSLDSGYCFRDLLPKLSYNDIRHPIITIVTFPVRSVLHTVLGWFVPANLLDALSAACIQFVNIQMLLLMGFMLRELSESRWILPLYLASAPVLLFTMFLEKHQLVVFFLVLYVYRLCRGEKGTEAALVLATGVMPTSAMLYANEVIEKEPLGRKAVKLFRILVTGVVVLLCTGRLHLLSPPWLMMEVTATTNSFGMRSLALKNCVFSLTKMAHSVFFFLPSTCETRYMWADVLGSPSVLGAVVFAVMLLGLLSSPRDRFTRVCAVWTVVPVILFCAVKWSVDESPLFGLYFAWAFLHLFRRGFQVILEKLRLNEKIAYGCLIVSMLAVNLSTLIDIGKFLRTLAY